jgi:chromosome segregation ATPase
MDNLERLDSILTEFENNNAAMSSIRKLIEEVAATSSEISSTSSKIKDYKGEMERLTNGSLTTYKSFQEQIEKENKSSEEFISSVKETLIKNNAENMTLYQNLVKSMNSNLELMQSEQKNFITKSQAEINDNIKKINVETIKKLEDIDCSVSNLCSNISEQMTAQFKKVNTMLTVVVIIGGVSVVLSTIALFI